MLINAKVVKSHVILHTVNKNEIMASFKKHQVKLFFGMLLGDRWMDHMEPISLIADYYGEKMALFMTFLIHHVGQMMIPSVFGLILWGYHMYYAKQLKETEPDLNALARYYNSVD